jgi:hypothetical protein
VREIVLTLTDKTNGILVVFFDPNFFKNLNDIVHRISAFKNLSIPELELTVEQLGTALDKIDRGVQLMLDRFQQ